jgi:hypothetical protein
MDMISRRGIHGSVVDGEDMKYAIFFLVLEVHVPLLNV